MAEKQDTPSEAKTVLVPIQGQGWLAIASFINYWRLPKYKAVPLPEVKPITGRTGPNFGY
jgi:hypothetical protein